MSHADSSYWNDSNYESPMKETSCYCRRCRKIRKHEYNLWDDERVYTCKTCGHQTGPGVANESGDEDDYDS